VKEDEEAKAVSPLISAEKRIMWAKRIRGFWQEFGRKKIGVIGLFLLVFFVVMAVFAPWLTPYQPLSSKRVATGFAVPEWIRILPEHQNLPSTHSMSFYWEKGEESEFIKAWGHNVEAQFESETMETVYVRFNASISYPETSPPDEFYITFVWSAEQINDIEYLLKMVVVNPKGEDFLLWTEGWNTKSKGESVYQNSYDPFLMDRLGLKLGVDNLAHNIFSEKGEYNFTLQMALKPQTENAGATITLQNANLVTLGSVHGILGTDNQGADIWAQVVYGARISLTIGLLAAILETIIGITVGVFAGYLGGPVDEILMRIVDILLCLPLLPLLLALVALFGANVMYIVLFVAIFGWQSLSRIVRSHVLSLRETSFIECARAAGATRFYIIIKHMIPNVLPIAFASMVLSVPSAILFEATLSFLGFGDPSAPTWGRMLSYAFGAGGFTHDPIAWWWVLPPGLAITFLCLAFVFMGHAVDEVINPRLRRRR
jgi:peptide/nickel transport system permease protein